MAFLTAVSSVVINLRIYLRDRFVNYVCTEVYVRQEGTSASVSMSACRVGFAYKTTEERNRANSLNAWLNSEHASV